MLDPRGQLLRAALRFADCSMPFLRSRALGAADLARLLVGHRRSVAKARRKPPRPKGPAMIAAVADALAAFILEHEYCGELNTGVEADRVWMTCTSGAGISRVLEPAGDA